jgi:hypothetical protein
MSSEVHGEAWSLLQVILFFFAVGILLTHNEDQFGYQFSKIMELDEPSGVFLNNSLYLAREKWGEEKGIHLRAKNEDWASLYKTDKPDQWICYLLHHPLSLRIMVSFFLIVKYYG